MGFGQRIGAFLFDGVLGGQDEERDGQRIGAPRGGDLPFLHGLEEGRLGLGRRAVHLVGQQNVGEHGSVGENEPSFPIDGVFLEDVGAGDVGGHEVRSELDSAELKVQGLGEGGD